MCPTAELLREGWRVSSRNDRYEVHSDGRIRNRKTGRELKPQQAGSGRYRKVQFGDRRQVQVHQLVAETWLGPKPTGMPHSVDHVDFDRTRNVVQNLRWLRYGLNSAQHRSDWPARAAALMPAPEDHEPITPDEEAQLLERMRRNGWPV
jgi:hypothetical protein